MFNNSKKIIQIILFLQCIPAHCLPRKLWWDLGHVKVTLNISIYKTNRSLGIDLGPRGLSDTPGHVCRGPSDALGRVRPKGRASWEVPGATEKYKKWVFHVPWTLNVHILQVFDGRSFSFRRSSEVLRGPGGPSRELLGACVWPMGALGGVLGEACMTLEGPKGGPGHRIRRPQGKVHDGKVHNNTHIPVVFWWFSKTTCFWKGGLHGR